jgi:hypothetical protein
MRRRGLGRVLYWLAVLAISLALLVALVLFLESRDEPGLDEARAPSEASLAVDYRGETSFRAA